MYPRFEWGLRNLGFMIPLDFDRFSTKQLTYVKAKSHTTVVHHGYRACHHDAVRSQEIS
jgi:hypothetical protein